MYAPHTSKGFVAPPQQEHAAGAERAAGEVRDVAGAAPRHRPSGWNGWPRRAPPPGTAREGSRQPGSSRSDSLAGGGADPMSAGPADDWEPTHEPRERRRIGVTGLAVMGRNLARNFARHGHVVALHNRVRRSAPAAWSPSTATRARSCRASRWRTSSPRCERPRRDHHHGQGGRADRRGDRRAGAAARRGRHRHRRRQRALPRHPPPRGGAARAAACTSSAAASPAARRARCNGPIIMPGGSAESYAPLGPMLESIAAQVDGTPCCTHVGPGRRRPLRQDGAQRHRVRRHAADRRGLRPAPAGLGARAGRDRRHLPRVERGRPRVVPDRDHRRGAGAHRRGDRQAVRRRRARPGRAEGHRPLDGAERARPRRPDHRHRRGDVRPLAVRSHADQREAAREAFGTDAAPCGGRPTATRFVEDVRRALYASKVVAYAQGFDQIAAGSAEYGWDIDRGAMATIWRGGCIIRARFLDRITRGLRRATRTLASLLVAAVLRRRRRATASTAGGGSWRRPRTAGVPTPAFSSSLAYYDGLRRRAAARRPDPGPAGLLRRPHLPPRRRRRHLPHRVGRRPEGAPRVDARPGAAGPVGPRSGGVVEDQAQGVPAAGADRATPRAAPGRPTSRARRRPAGRGW